MMGCHGPSEDVDDDDKEFLEAAWEDTTLVANLLVLLSRSEPCGPWRRLRGPTSPSAETEDAPSLPEPPKWATRRPRSRSVTMEGILAVKREDARRASPTTPLSWSGGGSGSSGSVCGDGRPTTPSRPPKRRMQRSLHEQGSTPPPPDSAKRTKPEPHKDEHQDGSPPSKWTKMETVYKGGESHGISVAGEPSAVGSFSGSGSNKAVAVGGPPRSAAFAEPLRLRWTSEGASGVARRPGKKKTLPELKAMEESLLQEQVELRREMEKQKKIYAALVEENLRLKESESSLAPPVVGEPMVAPVIREEAKSQEPRSIGEPETVKGPPSVASVVGEEVGGPEQPQCTSLSTHVPRRALLLDLNLLPDAHL